MTTELEYQLGAGIQSHYGRHPLAVKTLIVTDNTLSEQDINDIRRKTEEIAQILRRNYYVNDEQEITEAEVRKSNLLSCIPAGMQIYVKEIDNQYSKERLDKWLKIWTIKGPIIMGYRSHVINIEWGPTDWQDKSWDDQAIFTKVKELFPDYERTHGDYYLHVGNCEYATQVLEKLLS